MHHLVANSAKLASRAIVHVPYVPALIHFSPGAIFRPDTIKAKEPSKSIKVMQKKRIVVIEMRS